MRLSLFIKIYLSRPVCRNELFFVYKCFFTIDRVILRCSLFLNSKRFFLAIRKFVFSAVESYFLYFFKNLIYSLGLKILMVLPENENCRIQLTNKTIFFFELWSSKIECTNVWVYCKWFSNGINSGPCKMYPLNG